MLFHVWLATSNQRAVLLEGGGCINLSSWLLTGFLTGHLAGLLQQRVRRLVTTPLIRSGLMLAARPLLEQQNEDGSIHVTRNVQQLSTDDEST